LQKWQTDFCASSAGPTVREDIQTIRSLKAENQRLERELTSDRGSNMRRPALTRLAETGDLPIDNNPVENCIRPIALGKKNWLFAGSERAGQRAAVIQTLLGTTKLNGLSPSA